jgi:4-hydroxy-tetrahydrodipicolinate synthase
VVAIKEASGSLDQATEIIAETELTVLSGDDSLTLPMMAVGARGVVSVVANLAPADVKAMVDAALRSDLVQAMRIHHQLYPLVKAMFIETNPAPVKHALANMGQIAEEVRLPLVPVSRGSAKVIDEAIKTYGLSVAAGARV